MPRRSLEYLLKIAVIIACLWLIKTAVSIVPDTRGYGTHEQLGLERCGYLKQHGHPCPSCGMTTSFAHTVRLQLWQGLKANPAGTLLCLLVMIMPGILLHSLLTDTPATRLLKHGPGRYWFVVTLIVVGLSWAYKLLSYQP